MRRCACKRSGSERVCFDDPSMERKHLEFGVWIFAGALSAQEERDLVEAYLPVWDRSLLDQLRPV